MTLIFPVRAKLQKVKFGEGRITLQMIEKQIHFAQTKGSSILNILVSLPPPLSLSLSFIFVFLLIGLGFQNKDGPAQSHQEDVCKM